MKRMQGKRALITGGGAGIGAATARLFCQEGASVILVDQNAWALDELARALVHAGGHADIVVGDVAHPDVAVRAVELAVQNFGGLDVLVNNAAMRNYSAAGEATPEEWRAVLDVNLIGAANFCRATLPELRKSGRSAIVNVSSCYGVTGRRGMAIYDATKAGLIALTRTLAHEEAEYGIRANAVCPGSTLTDFHLSRGRAAGRTEEEIRGTRSDNSLLARWASPEEVAWPILWFASDEASFITGTHLLVDGGLAIF